MFASSCGVVSSSSFLSLSHSSFLPFSLFLTHLSFHSLSLSIFFLSSSLNPFVPVASLHRFSSLIILHFYLWEGNYSSTLTRLERFSLCKKFLSSPSLSPSLSLSLLSLSFSLSFSLSLSLSIPFDRVGWRK